MREQILKFLDALDVALVSQAPEGQRLDLYVIGKAAVILFYGGEQAGAATSDVDVVQISHPPAPLLSAALELFGKGTPGAKEHDLYLESVPDGIPPLAPGFKKRCTPMAGEWKVLTVWQPDANDLAASKLKRYAPRDRDDLRHLCDKGFLQEEKLRQSLNGAFMWETEETGDPDRERAFANLEKVLAYLKGDSRDL
jgi:Nucleotidyltransferase of unknown function (DUF6036)